MAKVYFQQSFLQFSVYDPSEIILICWFGAQEVFLIIMNVANIYAAYNFCGNRDFDSLKYLL